MENNSEINSIKLEMLNAFYFETKEIFKEYFEENFTIKILKHQINRLFNSWDISRIDIQNRGNDSNSIKIFNDNMNINVKYPQWFDNGRSCVIETKEKTLTINIKCIGDGKLNFYFRGVDFRNIHHKRVPVHINYTSLIYNDRLVFNTNKSTWHDNSYIYTNICRNNENLKIEIKFESIFDYYQKLFEFKNRINEANDQNLKEIYSQMEKYILTEKYNLIESEDNNTLIYKEHVKLTKNFNDLLTEFNIYKRETNKILDSYNTLFDNIFKFNKLKPIPIVKLSRELNNQLLDFIENVCKKHDLKWWLDFGVLLGAVRHSANIPWDDDYDISMLRSDYNKFFSIIHDEIKLNYLDKYLQVNLNKKGPNNSLLSFMKLEYFDKGRLFGFVDIFPYDYISKEIDDYENVKTIFYDEHYKFIDDLKSGTDRDTALNKYFQSFNVSTEKTDTMILGIEHFTYNQVKYDDVFPLKKIKFEDRIYPCPNKAKDFLRQEYGSDFMKVPKTVYHHGFHDALLSRYDDSLIVLEKHIALLKEINFKMSKELQ